MKRLDEIFDLRYGHSLELNALTRAVAPSGVNFVARAMNNNGVTARVLPPQGLDVAEAGEITVALSGNGVLSSFVQPEPFLTGYHVMILSPKDSSMPVEEKLWYCLCIWSNRHRYSYGRQANRTLGSLQVPEAPSWAEQMSVPSHDGLQASLLPNTGLSNPLNWKEFPLKELFAIKKGRRVTKAARTPGNTRFIGASDRNNGITDMCSLEPIFEAGTLSVPYNGSVGYSFFQDEPYFASDDIQVLIPNEPIDKWAMLFVSTVIRQEKNRFTYGYKWNMARMKKTKIRLPATLNGEPDWTYMERFMKGLPFSAALAEKS